MSSTIPPHEYQRDALIKERARMGLDPAEEQCPFLVIGREYTGNSEPQRELINLGTTDAKDVTAKLSAVFHEAATTKDSDNPRLERVFVEFLNGMDTKTGLAREWPDANGHVWNIYGKGIHAGFLMEAINAFTETSNFYKNTYSNAPNI